MPTYDNEVILRILGSIQKSFNNAINKAVKDLGQLEQATQKVNNAAKTQAESLSRASKGVSQFGKTTEESANKLEKFERYSKIFAEDMANGVKAADQAWQHFSANVKEGGVGLEYAKKRTRDTVNAIYDLDNRLASVNKQWAGQAKQIDFNKVRQAEYYKYLRTTSQGFEILNPKAAKFLGLSEEQVGALQRQSKSFDAYNKAMMKGYNISDRYTQALQKLGKQYGQADTRAVTYTKTLDKVNTAFSQIEAGMLKSGKGVSDWVKQADMAKVTMRALAGDIGLANNQLKLHNKTAVNALGITEDQAAQTGLLSQRYSLYGRTLQDLYKTNQKMVPAFQQLTQSFGKSDEAVKRINTSLTNTSKTIQTQLQGAWARLDQQVRSGNMTLDRAQKIYSALEQSINPTRAALNNFTDSTIKASKAVTEYDKILQKNSGRSQKFVQGLDAAAKKYGENSQMLQTFSRQLVKADDIIAKTAVGMERLGKNGQGFYNTANRMTTATKLLHGELKVANGMIGNVQKQMEGATKQGTLFSRVVGEVTQSFRSMAKYAAGAMIFYQLFTVLRTGEQAIRDFDQALKDLQAILNATDAEVSVLGDTIQRVAADTKFSTTEVADGMKLLGQAGLTTQEVVESIQHVSALATGTMADFKTTSDLVTTTMRAFNLEAFQSAEIVDVFANAINRSKLSIDKLRIAFNYVAPVAHKAGISFNEITAAMMQLANSGIRASTIGTGLRQVIRRLINPNEELKTAVKEAGFTLEEVNPMYNDLSVVIERLAEVVPTAADAFKFFKVRGAPAISALTNEGVDGFEKMLNSIRETGAAARMMTTQTEGLGIKWKQVGDRFTVIATKLGDDGLTGAFKILADIIRVVEDGLIKLLDNPISAAIIQFGLLTTATIALTQALKALQAAFQFTIVTKTIAKFTALKTAMFNLATGATTLSAAAKGLKVQLAALWGVIRAHPILLAVSAFVGLSTAVIKSHKAFDNIEQKYDEQVIKLKNVTDKIEYYHKRLKETEEGTEEYRNIMVRLLEDFPELKDEVDLLTMSWNDNLDVLKEFKKLKMEEVFKAYLDGLDALINKSRVLKAENSGGILGTLTIPGSEQDKQLQLTNEEIEERLKNFAQMLNDELPESVDIFKLSVDELIEKTKEVTGVELELSIAQKLKKEIQDMEKSSKDLDKMIRGFGTAWKVASEELETAEQKRQLLELARAYKKEADRIGEYYRELTESTGKDFSDEQDKELYELHRKTKKRVQDLFSDIDFPIEKMGQQYITAFNELPKEIQESIEKLDLGERISILEKVSGGMDEIKEDVSEYRKSLVAQIRMGFLDAKTDIESMVDEFRLGKIKDLIFDEEEEESTKEVKSMLDKIKVDFRSFIDDLIEEGRRSEALDIAPQVREEFKQEMQNIKFQIQDLKEERDKFASGELVTEKERAKLKEYNLTIKFLEESLVELERELETYGNTSVAAWADASKYSLEFKNKLKEIDNEYKEKTPEWYKAIRQLIAEYKPLYEELLRINDKIELPKEAREALKKFGWGLDKAGDKADKFATKIKELKYELENMEKEGEFDKELARIEQRYASEQRKFLETYYLKKDHLEDEKNRAKEYYEEVKNSAEATEIEKINAEKNYKEKKDEYDQYLLENSKQVTENIANMHVSGATKVGDAWEKELTKSEAFLQTFEDGFEQGFAELKSTVYDWSGNIAKVFKDTFNDLSNTMTDFIMDGKADWKDFSRTVLRYITEMLVKASMLQAVSMGKTALGTLFHTGGVVGKDKNQSRFVPNDVFDGAKRFHDGLMPNEFPAILQKGEVVFTKAQMQALGKVMGGNNASSPNVEVNVINKTSEKVNANQKGEPKFDGDKWVLNVVLDAANRNKNNFGKNLKGSLSKA